VCRQLARRIRATERHLEMLKARQDQISCGTVENVNRNSTGASDSFFLPAGRFEESCGDPAEFSTELDWSTTATGEGRFSDLSFLKE